MPTTRLGRRLDQVATEQHRQQHTRRRRDDLAMFSDDELDELSELARSAEDAAATAQPMTWTAEELLILDRLGAKHAAQRRW